MSDTKNSYNCKQCNKNNLKKYVVCHECGFFDTDRYENRIVYSPKKKIKYGSRFTNKRKSS